MADTLPPRGLTRRRFLGAAGAVGGLVAADTFGLEPRWLEVTEHAIPVRGLPASLRGFTIAQLTDVHLTALGTLHTQIRNAVNAHQANLVVLTGDLIETRRAMGTLTELVHSLRAPDRTVVATMGNWEYWGGLTVEDMTAVHARGGSRLLSNENLVLPNGLVIAACDDGYTEHHDIRATLRNLPAGDAKLFLTHSPALFDRIPSSAPRFDLALAGHTHGGQVRVGRKAIWLPDGSGRFESGMYDVPTGRAYVSRGIGLSIFPVRLMCLPELPIFRLVQG